MENSNSSFLNWGLMPAYIGASEQDAFADSFHEMRWGFRANDRVFGVLSWPSLEEIYQANHNQLVGQTWVDHLASFAEFVSSHQRGGVLEIGAGHGKLGPAVNGLQKESPELVWHIVEPNPLSTNELGVLVSGWFPQDVPRDLEVQTIVHSHVIEHQPNLQEFVQEQAEYLDLGGRVILSWPNMTEMSRNLDLNVLMFEHLNFLPKGELIKLFECYGFSLIDTNEFGSHSIFACFEKTQVSTTPFTTTVKAKDFEMMCERYKKHAKSFSDRLNSFFGDSTGPTLLFGAHIFAQYLLVSGLEQDRISAILDNNNEKWGKRLYGSSLIIEEPSKFEAGPPVKVGLAMGNYETEIVEQLKVILPKKSQLLGSRTGWLQI